MTDFGSVRFFRTKTGSNRFGSVFSVWLGLLGFGSVFFQFFSAWVWFGSVRFFWFQVYKTKTEPKSVQIDQFKFDFLGQKLVQTGLARFF